MKRILFNVKCAYGLCGSPFGHSCSLYRSGTFNNLTQIALKCYWIQVKTNTKRYKSYFSCFSGALSFDRWFLPIGISRLFLRAKPVKLYFFLLNARPWPRVNALFALPSGGIVCASLRNTKTRGVVHGYRTETNEFLSRVNKGNSRFKNDAQ